jgi:hypothetical protein
MSTLRVDNIKSRTGTTVTIPETNTLAVTGIVSVTSTGSITNAGNLTNTGSLTNSGNVNITGGITTVGGSATISGNVFIAGDFGIGTESVPTKFYVQGNAASNIVGLGTTTATTTFDFTQGNNFSLILGATITIANPTGVTTGQSGLILIQENSTGGYTCGWGTSWDFASSTAPTLTTTANALNALPYFARSTTSIVVGSVIAGIGTL